LPCTWRAGSVVVGPPSVALPPVDVEDTDATDPLEAPVFVLDVEALALPFDPEDVAWVLPVFVSLDAPCEPHATTTARRTRPEPGRI
jgi:hypothetical protein